MGQKPNGQTASLDSRIASTLASDDCCAKAALVKLVEEAGLAIAEARATIDAESEALLDIANEDPDTSDDVIRKAKRTIARLEKATPELKRRIAEIDKREYRTAWNARADVLRAERDDLAEELAEIYAPFLAQITNLYARIDANTAAIGDLHLRAPSNEDRLTDAELTARGLDSYDAQHPRLRDNLKLPEFIRASVVSFPPDPMQTWNQYAMRAHEAMRQRMIEKFGLSHSPDWAAARDLEVERAEHEFAKRDAELKQQELESKRKYEEGLKHVR